MATWHDLAEQLFPKVTTTIPDLLAKYPERTEPVALRFAPSPTGYLHFGGLYTSFVGWKYAKEHQGIYFLRIEDTDQKREVEGAASLLIQSLKKFGITIDEGPLWENESDVGEYGPYFQSKRADFYKVFIKHLIREGLAYPCRMSEGELNTIRDTQMKSKQIPGIYGRYSTYRDWTPDQLLERYNQEGQTFSVLRFRSHGDTSKKIVFEDEIRGVVSMIDNYNDIVILKGDGLPTYHLAHIVDDTLMRASLVTRGEEWLTSVPLHLQLFDAFGLRAPKYAHLATICKIDAETGKKRKLSKRHDPEANVHFFFEKGYSTQGLIEYILTLASSSFEDWRRENPLLPISDFDFRLDKMNVSGPLFDEVKLNWVNNAYLSAISTPELYQQTLAWAEEFQPEFSTYLKQYPEYAEAAMNIERHTEKDPKRFTLYSDVQHQLLFFFDTEWEKGRAQRIDLLSELNQENLPAFVKDYINNVDLTTEDAWVRFSQLKEIGRKYGYAANNAEFKEGGFVGKVGDLAMFLRVQLCNAKQTPDLFSVMKVMGKARVVERLEKYLG